MPQPTLPLELHQLIIDVLGRQCAIAFKLNHTVNDKKEWVTRVEARRSRSVCYGEAIGCVWRGRTSRNARLGYDD